MKVEIIDGKPYVIRDVVLRDAFEWNSRDGWRIECADRIGSSCLRCRLRQAWHLWRNGNTIRVSLSGLFRR